MDQLEKEVNGFNDTIEQLRAAGRVEAMEDLMSNLMVNLVSIHLITARIVHICSTASVGLLLIRGERRTQPAQAWCGNAVPIYCMITAICDETCRRASHWSYCPMSIGYLGHRFGAENGRAGAAGGDG